MGEINNVINDMGIFPETLDEIDALDFDNILLHFNTSSSLGLRDDRLTDLKRSLWQINDLQASNISLDLEHKILTLEKKVKTAKDLFKAGLMSGEDYNEIGQELNWAIDTLKEKRPLTAKAKTIMQDKLKETLDVLENDDNTLLSDKFSYEMKDLDGKMRKVTREIDHIKNTVSEYTKTVDDKLKLMNDLKNEQRLAEFTKDRDAYVEAGKKITDAKVEYTEAVKNETEATSKWQKFKDMEKSLSKSVDGVISSLKGYEGVASIDVVTTAKAKIIANLLEEISAPFRSFTTSIKNAGDKIMGSYELYADKLIQDNDLDEFYKAIKNDVSDAAIDGTEYMKAELSTYTELLKSDATTDELVSAIAKFNSCSFKMISAVNEDLQDLIEGTKLDFSLVFQPVKWVYVAAKSTTKLAGGTASYIIESIGEKIGGEMGLAVADAVAEALVGSAALVLGGTLFLLGPEVQAALLLSKMAKDVFISHNKYEVGERLAHDVPGVSLLVDFNKLKLKEYPQKTKIRGVSSKNFNPIGVNKYDVAEDHMILDFWGDQYIKMMALYSYTYPTYRRWKPFEAIERISGLYTDRDILKYSEASGLGESKEEVEACIEIDNHLETHTLISTNDTLSGGDKGQHLLRDVYPPAYIKGKKKNGINTSLVRNWVAFPLYENTMRWPSLDGEQKQSAGFFDREEMDATIYDTLILWANSGTYGNAYNLAKDDSTRKTATETNQKDLKFWLKPDKANDPLAWVKCKMWLEGNRGKAAIMKYNMYKLQLDSFDKTYNKPVDPASLPHVAKDGNDEVWQKYIMVADPIHGSPPNDLEIQYHYETYGMFPMHDRAISFYTDLTNNGEYVHARKAGKYQGYDQQLFGTDVYVFETKKATQEQNSAYSDLLNSFFRYRDALLNAHGNAQLAFSTLRKDMAWEEYISDTASNRTVDGYVRQNRELFFKELEAQTLKMSGDKEIELMVEYRKAIEAAGVPLNMNSYHRALFMGKMNQLLFSDDTDKVKKLQKEFDATTGGFVAQATLTTGFLKTGTNAWWKVLAGKDIVKIQFDLPLGIGALHCRMGVIKIPRPTLIICFRGTTNTGEVLVDLDFTGTDYASLSKDGNGKDKYGLHVYNDSTSTAEKIKKIMFTDSSAFTLHRGFLRAWMGFRKQVFETHDQMVQMFKVEDVLVSGHSLGAAVAQIACLELPGVRMANGNYKRPHFYGFSSPAVGDKRFQRTFNMQCSESIQVYIDGDALTMIPPFLLPDTESWGGNMGKLLEEIEQLEGMSGSKFAKSMAVVSFLLGYNIMHLPAQFKPSTVMKDGKIDNVLLLSNIAEIWQSYNDHKAVRGGGLFIRLDASGGGTDLETSYDAGSTVNSISNSLRNLRNPITRTKKLHSLSNVVNGLSNIVKDHPDAFAVVDGKLPEWGDDAVRKISSETKPKVYKLPTGKRKRSTAELRRSHRDIKIYRHENDYHTY